jgi:hypothetical protein
LPEWNQSLNPKKRKTMKHILVAELLAVCGSFGLIGSADANDPPRGTSPVEKVAAIATPPDAEIGRLGVDLNKTYIPYGTIGREGEA